MMLLEKMLPENAVVVSQKALSSDEPYDLIFSNIMVVNSLRAASVPDEDIAPDALRSYSTDYYAAQVHGGGLAEFAYGIGWNETVVRHVCEGLTLMNALEHAAHFQEAARCIEEVGLDHLDAFFAANPPGTNALRNTLDAFDDRFLEIEKRENILRQNAAWLRSLPHLHALSADDIEAFIAQRAALYSP